MFDFNAQINAIKNNQAMLNNYFSNLQHFTTVGYKAGSTTFQDIMNNVSGQGIGATTQSEFYSFTQGSIQKTGNPTDMAINGSGFFVVSDGKTQAFTRAGKFVFKDGNLVDPSSGMKVQGYKLDANGNPTKELTDISLKFDPNTKLYDGKYTGYHIGDDGVVYGERRVSDPLTGQVQTESVPIYKVALANFANPSGLKRISDTTFVASDTSGKPVLGVSGEGAMGKIVPQSLEMSNISIADQVSKIMMAKINYNANFAAFKAMDKLTQSAIGLVR